MPRHQNNRCRSALARHREQLGRSWAIESTFSPEPSAGFVIFPSLDFWELKSTDYSSLGAGYVSTNKEDKEPSGVFKLSPQSQMSACPRTYCPGVYDRRRYLESIDNRKTQGKGKIKIKSIRNLKAPQGVDIELEVSQILRLGSDCSRAWLPWPFEPCGEVNASYMRRGD